MSINKTITVTNTDNGETSQWTLDKVLDYVNADRNDEWIDYTASDWVDGWKEWIRDEDYSFQIADADLRDDYFK